MNHLITSLSIYSKTVWRPSSYTVSWSIRIHASN